MTILKLSSTLDLKRDPTLNAQPDMKKLGGATSENTCLNSVDNQASFSLAVESSSPENSSPSVSKKDKPKCKAKARAKGKAKAKAFVESVSSPKGDKGQVAERKSTKSSARDSHKSVCIVEPAKTKASTRNSVSASKSTRFSEAEKLYCVDSEVRVPKSLYQRLDRSAEIRKLTGCHTLIRTAHGDDCLVEFSRSVGQQLPLSDDEEWSSRSDVSCSASSRFSGSSSDTWEDGTADMIPSGKKRMSQSMAKLQEGDNLVFSPTTAASLRTLARWGELTREPCNRNGAQKVGKASKRKSFAKRLLGRAADENKGDTNPPPKRKSFFERVKQRISGRKSQAAEEPSQPVAEE